MNTTPPAPDERTILDESFLSIRYRPTDDMIVLRWRGYASPVNFRFGLEEALAFVAANKVKRWLADLRHMEAILTPEEKWTNEVWFPRVFQSTVLQRMAILPSRDFFNQQSVDRIMDRTVGSRSFQVGYFPDEEEAVEWLFDRQVSGVATP